MWEDFLLTGPKGQCRRVQSQDIGQVTHTQLPGAFSLAVPALHQLSEDMEGGRWAEDNRPMSRAQSIQNT